MARDPYSGRGSRWDAERFVRERERFEDTRGPRGTGGPLVPRPRERSVDETYERRVGGGRTYEDDRYRERAYYDEPEGRPMRRESVTIEREKEREVYSPSPPRRAPAPPRPGLIRRQSSLDTFDRRPFPRFEREEYGPPARREDFRPAYVPPPIPRYRALPPPRRYVERDFEEIKISEPELYGDDEYRPYPERVREREIIRTRRRSRSKESHARSVSSSSSSSRSSVSTRREFPKRGKTRMPSKMVSIKAIIELGYPYEREGEVVIIQKALGPENIDEVIKLSESYKKSERVTIDRVEMSGGRSDAGTVVEERREEVITIPTHHGHGEVIEKTTFEHRETSPARAHFGRSRSVGPSPRIVDTRGPITYEERSNHIPVGPLVLLDSNRSKDERAIRAEIRALEAEKEALRAEQKASLELRRAEQIRREGRSGELVVYEEVEMRRNSHSHSSSDKIEIKKDKKAAQARALATMLKTLT